MAPFWYPTHRFLFGDIAQLVERLNGIEKVRGSTPLISTIPKVRFADTDKADFLVFGEARFEGASD